MRGTTLGHEIRHQGTCCTETSTHVRDEHLRTTKACGNPLRVQAGCATTANNGGRLPIMEGGFLHDPAARPGRAAVGLVPQSSMGVQRAMYEYCLPNSTSIGTGVEIVCSPVTAGLPSVVSTMRYGA